MGHVPALLTCVRKAGMQDNFQGSALGDRVSGVGHSPKFQVEEKMEQVCEDMQRQACGRTVRSKEFGDDV